MPNLDLPDMDENTQPSRRRKETAFNAAVISLNILAYSLAMANEFSRQLDVSNWYHTLRQIRKIIWPKLTMQERRAIDEILLSNNMSYQLAQNQRQAGRYPGRLIQPGLYDKLDRAEILMREAADRAGMLMPNKKSITDTITED